MIKTVSLDIKTRKIIETEREQTLDEITQSIASALEIEKLAAEAVAQTDLQAKPLSMIAGLKADLGSGLDPAGSTTIGATLNQTNANINSSPATYIKSLARFMRSSHKAEIRAIRLLLRELSSVDDLDSDQPE